MLGSTHPVHIQDATFAYVFVFKLILSTLCKVAYQNDLQAASSCKLNFDSNLLTTRQLNVFRFCAMLKILQEDFYAFVHLVFIPLYSCTTFPLLLCITTSSSTCASTVCFLLLLDILLFHSSVSLTFFSPVSFYFHPFVFSFFLPSPSHHFNLLLLFLQDILLFYHSPPVPQPPPTATFPHSSPPPGLMVPPPFSLPHQTRPAHTGPTCHVELIL